MNHLAVSSQLMGFYRSHTTRLNRKWSDSGRRYALLLKYEANKQTFRDSNTVEPVSAFALGCFMNQTRVNKKPWSDTDRHFIIAAKYHGLSWAMFRPFLA
jgi:hypothetical protein